jgi:hypothetical protein
MSKQSEAIEKASQILVKTNAEISELLKGPELQMIGLSVTTDLNRITNRLNHLGGLSINLAEKIEFPPVTNFMGEDITTPKEVTREQLSPLPDDVKILKEKVDRLYLVFDTIAAEGSFK